MFIVFDNTYQASLKSLRTYKNLCQAEDIWNGKINQTF